jgi:hypothetical protein
MRRASRIVLSVALATCTACSGDYWLGGERGHPGAGGGNAPIGAGPNDRVLGADVVLTGNESLNFNAGDGGGCRVVGNGHSIRSEGAWSGHLSIRGCTVEGLGSASTRAISLEMSGGASTTIEGTTFGGSGAVHLTNEGESTTIFRNNVILGSSVVPLDPSADITTSAFFADGTSTSPKVFQGNRIYRSSAWFQSANWLIGGDHDRDGNLLIGLRAGLVLAASGLVVRGNYVHVVHFTGSGDEAAIMTMYGTTDVLAEHNVLRGGTWVLRGFGGELRYTAVLDSEASGWLNQPFENTKVHHDLFLMCDPPRSAIDGGVHLVNTRAVGIELYNNTLDGGGPTMELPGAPVVIDSGCFLSSLRSNLIFNFPFQRNDDGAAAIRPGLLEGVDPPPPRLGYADYNLFYNPQASRTRNYAVSVPGRTVRVSAGFAEHDSHAGGPVDEQVDPGPLGLPDGCFPWSDDDIKATNVTVSQMLSAWRVAYTPGPSSAPILAGDPADGPANPIGAIGDGTMPQDLFGKYGP